MRTQSVSNATVFLTLVVGALTASAPAGCTKTARCRDGTVVLTIEFDPSIRALARQLEVDVQIDGGTPKRNPPISLPATGTTLVLEIDFPNHGYPANRAALLTVSPIANGGVVGPVKTFPETLAVGCDAWTISLIDVPDADVDRGDTPSDVPATDGVGGKGTGGAGGANNAGGTGGGGVNGIGGGAGATSSGGADGGAGNGGTSGGAGAAGSGMGGMIVVAPRVITTSPATGTKDASPGGTISATFSASMDPTTLTSATFAVNRGATTVAGTLSVMGAAVTFTPARPLVLGAAYQVTIGAGVKDVAGVATGADYSWAFATRDGSYGPSRAISAVGPDSEDPALAVDAAGDAMILWTQSIDATHTKVYGARYTPAAGWFAPTLVDAADAQSMNPAVAMSDDGTAVAIFALSAGLASAASSRFTAATGWSAPVPTAPVTLNRSVAMDGAGQAVAVYEANGAVNAKSFTPTAGWSSEQMLSGSAIFPQVALASAGTGVATFNAFVEGGEQVYAARYTGAVWLAADPVSAVGTGNFSAVTLDSAGVPVVLWAVGSQAFSSRLVAGNWSAPALVGPAPGSGEIIALSQEPTDNVVAVMSSGTEVWANIESGGIWRTATKLNVLNDTTIGSTSAAMAPNGNAIVVWSQAGSVWIARPIEGTGWILSQALPDGATTTFSTPRVRIDGSGRATIVFQRADTTTTNHIRAIRFE